MPTKLSPRGEATRSRIVAAAAQLMFERGVAGSTLEDIRAEAGVSSSQIYHYFADKQALVLAVIEHQTDAILETQQPALANLDSMDGLRAWREQLIDHQRRLHCIGGCPLGSLGGELAESVPEVRADLATAFRRWEHSIGAGLQAMHARGELDADPGALALALLSALQGGILMTQIQRRTEPLEATLDAMLDHIASRIVAA